MVQYRQMDGINVDELTNGLCRAGEECFRRGAFKEALRLLLRCIKSPKSIKTRQAFAKSYRMLGMIYGHLGQEMLAKEYLLKALELSKENGFEYEELECYLSLAFFHELLGDYEQAFYYQEKILTAVDTYKKKEEKVQKLEIICLAHRGIVYSKTEKSAYAEVPLTKIENLLKEKSIESDLVPVLSLALVTAHVKREEEQFLQCFRCLLQIPILEEGFFETLEYYFELCAYFYEKEMQEEWRALLDYIKSYYDMLPLSYLKYNIHNWELLYAKKYGSEEEQWQAAQELLAIMPEYEAEQQYAKIYSFDYIEYLHEERDLSAKMEQKSKLDPMTGLFNKFTIEYLVDEYFSKMGENSVAALLMIDMDHFKQINDTLGHLAGDAILTDTASVIRRFFKRGALCGRVGGDEFMVFVKDIEDISSLLLQTEFLRQEIGKTTSERNITISIQASVGIAVSTAGFKDYASMFEAADEALYRAKKGGRNRICVIE